MKKNKRKIALGLALMLVMVGLFVIPSFMAADDPPPTAFKTDLIADGGKDGEHIDVGDVYAWYEGTILYIKYITGDGWVMTETHLDVAESLTDIPQTKNGNPKPGRFYFGDSFDPPVSSWTYTIDISSFIEEPIIAAHARVIKPIEGCWETVWQIGDVEIDDGTGHLTNYCDEFNYAGFYEGAGPVDPPFTTPFVVGTTPTNEFPWISIVKTPYGPYATDYKVQWSGELPFGGKLTISWSPGKSGTETKIITSIDDGVPYTFIEYGSTDPSGWYNYPLLQSELELDPVNGGSHEIRFQHTTGDGALWDWILLEKPCVRMESAWAAGEDFQGKNWATYIGDVTPTLVDTVNVYARWPSDKTGENLPVESNLALQNGVDYRLKVTGTADALNEPGRHIYFDVKFSISTEVSGDTWTDLVTGYHSYGTELLDLHVDGIAVDWGEYSEDHTYYWTLTGDGTPIDLHIYDIFCQNNVGYLTVEIWELP